MKKLFLLSLVLTFPVLSGSRTADFPEQQCKEFHLERIKSIMDELLGKDTEAGYCFSCEKNQGWSFRQIVNATPPKECFAAMALSGSRKFRSGNRHVYCQRGGRGVTKKRKLCVNKDYVDMIHKAFSFMAGCFNMDYQKQWDMMYMLYQESGMISNARSHTGATCLGQLTQPFVKTINKNINPKFANTSNSVIQTYQKLHNEVVGRCPGLKNAILKKVSNSRLDCQSVRNPYTCLFYTFFGFEKDYRMIEETMNSPLDINPEVSDPKIRKMYKLPIKLNEMLSVKFINKNGKEKQWIIWDDSELAQLVHRIKTPLEIKKIPLLKDPKDLTRMFTYWAHNGGSTYARSRMVTSMEGLKKTLKRSCRQSNNSPKCKARRALESGKSIDNKYALNFFKYYVKHFESESTKSRQKEVIGYAGQVIKNSQTIFSYEKNKNGKLSRATREMIGKYQKATGISKEEATKFQKEISETCAKPDLI